jgi:FtsP/CotA-like multicopper oxidase with cupredoxin domain
MFARIEDLPLVRQQERSRDVTPGLQGDAIQPLVLRAHAGECLRMTLRNDLPEEAASIVVHGAGLQLPAGGAATATNPRSFARPGATVVYEWQIPDDEPEGTHYLHSAGDERVQVDHGLFGAVVVEPPGSTWTDPRTDEEARGWDALVTPRRGHAFREFVLVYHEVGDETFQVSDRNGRFLPLVDPITSAYRPGTRALNYRSEPFMDRLALGRSVTGHVDESLAYSSYAYGDPATPMMRTYLGEPVKQRVLHGGSEVFHVHHVHGGSVRWRRQPGAEDTGFATGLDKKPVLIPKVTERTDAQTIGPSEAFDVEDECASGGCQQSTGDFLYHCHIAHHYFAGMWGLWRVYDTLQDGRASTDALPPLRALADIAPAVPARALVGSTVDFFGTRTTITAADLPSWVERQLPPPGVPKGYDASVWDWVRDGDRYLGEPETAAQWPGYRARAPGDRPELLFDPHTGKLAYPFLRPHLAARPPFAPNHGPSPHLDSVDNGRDPVAPGGSGRGSLCPAGTTLKHFDINAIRTPVPLNAKAGLVDRDGELFVLRGQVDAARRDPALQVPLALRANAGEDCVDILLRSELQGTSTQPFSKVSMHIHFVQFDAQASDGLDAGFNYEQTIRPFREEGSSVTAPADAGATSVTVDDASRFSVGAVVGVGIDRDATFDVRRIASIAGTTIAFDRPLAHEHAPGEIVSAEFVRYRWYPDAQFGTAYFHDHVDAIHSWVHGLFGALIAEPPGSTYTDPKTGAPLASGQVADIHTTARISADVRGSFRELALFVQDDNRIDAVGRSTGSAFGLRAEPLDRRTGPADQLFSSGAHGDPATLTVEANLGDPVVLRSLVGSTNDIHTVHLDGHWFRTEPWTRASPPVNTVRVGISERFDLVVPAAGGPQRIAGDYLYYSGRPFKLREGSWGLVRVHAAGDGGLRPLPGHGRVPASATAVCPPDAPSRSFDVTAIDLKLPMLGGRTGKLYVLDSQRAEVASGRRPAEPLVLHANVGDCLHVSLTNATADSDITYHCDLLAADPATSGGVAAGNEPSSAVAPGQRGSFTFYAAPEIGETVSMVRDFGDVLDNPGLGLYGAIVVGAKGTTYRGEGWQVDAFPPNGSPYRDATLLFEDSDEAIGTHRMPYATTIRGAAGVNYRTATRGIPPADPSTAFQSTSGRTPATPTIDAYAGDRLRIHVLAPYSEQVQVFGIEGHEWSVMPELKGSNVVGATAVGGLEALTIQPIGGAGGRQHVPGDYVYGAVRGPYRDAGLWGLLRVHAPSARVDGLEHLTSHDGATSRGLLAGAGGAVVVLALGTALLLGRRRRRAS